MKKTKTDRGFQLINHDKYSEKGKCRLIQQSSAVGDYDNSLSAPGSSFLWVGEKHHLNRSETEKLVGFLTHWLTTGELF